MLGSQAKSEKLGLLYERQAKGIDLAFEDWKISKLSPELLLSQMACSFAFVPPFVRPIRRPRPPRFDRQTGGRAMRLEIDAVDHDGLRLAVVCGQTHHHFCKTPLSFHRYQRLHRVLYSS